jgi:putative tryptophan/tyrosine transport system substrate-binding protein
MRMRRRLILTLAAAPAYCWFRSAQSAETFRVGWISLDRGGRNSSSYQSFRDGLRDLGYVDGANLVIDARWGEGSRERLAEVAGELIRSKPDVIVTQGPAIFPVLAAKDTIPIVFGFSGDPVDAGFVNSFARPGQNSTGVSFLALELVGKSMELLKEVMPGLKRVAIIANPGHAGQQSELRASQTAATTLGLTLEYFQVRTEAELDNALAALPKSRSEASVVFPDAFTMGFSAQIAAAASATRIPAISGWA